MTESWKPISGFEQFYAVSNTGRVQNINTGRDLKPFVNDNGYGSVKLFNGKSKREAKVHRLVAEAFIPNPENKPQVNHIDRNKLNNNVSNLEWVTNKENFDHAVRTGLNKTRNSKLAMNKRYRSKFVQLTLLVDPEVNKNLTKLAEATGRTRTALCREAINKYLAKEDEL